MQAGMWERGRDAGMSRDDNHGALPGSEGCFSSPGLPWLRQQLRQRNPPPGAIIMETSCKSSLDVLQLRDASPLGSSQRQETGWEHRD